MVYRFIVSNMSTEMIIYSFISTMIVLLICLPVHEFAHAFMAYKMGDRTAKNQGRLTLNPFAHLDPIGSLIIFIAGFGWAKPVPVNMYNLRNKKRDMAIIALAGPVSNLIVSFLFVVLAQLVYMMGDTDTIFVTAFILIIAAAINIYLAVFNLLPIPPLDGSRILNMLLPNHMYYKIMQYENYIFIIVIFLVFTGALSVPLTFIADVFLGGFLKITDSIFGGGLYDIFKFLL